MSLAFNTFIESCESTNDLARELALAGYPAGTWIAAWTQTKGRGRGHGRVWISERGGLYISVLIDDVEDAEVRKKIPELSARAFIRAAESLGVRNLEIKASEQTPNDVMMLTEDGPAKVAGILCEQVRAAPKPKIIVGLGANCLTLPDVKDQRVTKLDVDPSKVGPTFLRELGLIFIADGAFRDTARSL